jgi:hypothetical protein
MMASFILCWRRRARGAALLAALLCAACSHAHVIKQASPNPFVGARTFSIEVPDYSRLLEDGATRRNESFQRDKKRVADTFLATLREETDGMARVAHARPDTMVVRSFVTGMHGGISLGITSSAARIEMTVQLLRNGQVLDEVAFEAEATQDEGFKVMGVDTDGYSGSARLEQAAKRLAGYVADYIEDRIEP